MANKDVQVLHILIFVNVCDKIYRKKDKEIKERKDSFKLERSYIDATRKPYMYYID